MTFCFCSLNAMAMVLLFNAWKKGRKASSPPSSKLKNRHTTPTASISCEAEGLLSASLSSTSTTGSLVPVTCAIMSSWVIVPQTTALLSAARKGHQHSRLERYLTRSSTWREGRAWWCHTSERCADWALVPSIVTLKKLAAAAKWNARTRWHAVRIIDRGDDVRGNWWVCLPIDAYVSWSDRTN